jgi:uncharacterized protein (TIGR02453 family)
MPFHTFVNRLIEKIKELDPRITITSKEAVFRIYRDIRFSKDKTPYKEHISALISRGGRKDHSTPGLYIELRKEGLHIYSGVYEPNPAQLSQIRNYIAANLKDFEKALTDKKFVKRFGKILGEKNKVLSSDLKEAAIEQPLIYNKNFYYTTALEVNMIYSDKLIQEVLQCYKDAAPLSAFFEKALKS